MTRTFDSLRALWRAWLTERPGAFSGPIRSASLETLDLIRVWGCPDGYLFIDLRRELCALAEERGVTL